jgi:hypothetical protein
VFPGGVVHFLTEAFDRLSPWQVRNNYSDLQSVRGNVRVRSGRWYFETVVQTTGNIYIGWCSKDFKGEVDVCAVFCCLREPDSRCLTISTTGSEACRL